MAEAATVLSPVPGFRDELLRRGGGDAARCFQCATCTSVCDLATTETAFPRRQMLWAQWGLADRLSADPSIWLCHQCNDCTTRCPLLRGRAASQRWNRRWTRMSTTTAPRPRRSPPFRGAASPQAFHERRAPIAAAPSAKAAAGRNTE